MGDVMVVMPLHITHELISAVRNNEMTKIEDRDEMNKRIGWLIAAYDVMVEKRATVHDENPTEAA